MKKDKTIILAAPYIGDTVFIWNIANRLAQAGKDVVFVTYFPKLLQNINELENIIVLDIVSGGWKNCINSNLIISNHAAEKTELGYIPEPLSDFPSGSYQILDLHSKQRLGRTSKLENYPDLMWKKVAKIYETRNYSNVYSKKGRPLFKEEIIEKKFLWTSKPYILIISGASSPSKKYSNWNEIAEKIEQSYGIGVLIANDPAEHDELLSRNKVFRLDEFPLIFKHSNCQMVLGSDTGLCHLAAWMKKHTALIFSISDPTFWTSDSRYYHPIIGSKNLKNIKKIQKKDLRLDPPEVRGKESLTKEGFGANLTTENEILEVVSEVIGN